MGTVDRNTGKPQPLEPVTHWAVPFGGETSLPVRGH